MMETELVELVPNVSEGRNRPAVRSMADALARPEEVWVLDVHSDPSHNRSVLTAAARPAGVAAAIEALAERALEVIDLRDHRGIHPRNGALDVVPLVSLGGVSPEKLDALAVDAARSLSERTGLPVCLYGRLATREGHRTLGKLRRGGFEALDERMRRGEIVPDFGPKRPHASAGLVALGARDFLIAFNVNLQTEDVEVAKSIARVIRASSGGLPHLQALGFPLEDRSLVQVSMNLTCFRETSLEDAFEAVRAEAERRSVRLAGSEIVGLVPEAACFEEMEARLRLDAPPGVLEQRLARAMGTE